MLIPDKVSNIKTTDKPFSDDFVSQKLKDKREDDNHIAKAILLNHVQDDLISLFK